MKEKIKSVALQVLSCLITMAICLGAWGGGLAIADGNADPYIWVPIICACVFLLVAAILINILGSKAILRKFNSMKMRELYDWSEKIKTEIESSYSNAEKSVRKVIVLSYLYLFFLIALILFLCFCIGFTTSKSDDGSVGGIISVMIPLIFICWGLVNVFFTSTDSPVPSSEYELKEAEYPLMFRTVKRAAEACGFKKGYKIFACNEGIFVNTAGSKAVMHVGYMEFALLTGDELYNVMLHEFAHVLNKDSSRGAKFSREEQRWGDESSGNVITQFARFIFLPLPSALICFKTSIYSTIASRFHEISADEAIQKYGNPQHFINALAKSGLLSKFEALHCRELTYDFYAPEKPTGDYAKQEYELFFKYREKYADMWIKQLKCELPARVSSHPTFNMRCEAMQIESFDAYAAESNPDYVLEQKKYLELNDKFMNKDGIPVYGELREKNYLSVKRVIDGYYDAEKNGQSLRDDELLTALQQFYQVDNDEALKIADRLLTVNPELSEANMIKGLILMQRMDDGCVTCFKTACKDPFYTEGAMTCIGQYALISGNNELLQEYRNSAPETMQESRDKEEIQKIDKKTTFEKCDLDKEVIDGAVEGILEASFKQAEKIYAVKFKDKQNNPHYVIIPVFKKDCKFDEFNKYMGKIYNFLTFYTDNDFILFANDKTKITKLIKNTEGALIYGR